VAFATYSATKGGYVPEQEISVRTIRPTGKREKLSLDEHGVNTDAPNDLVAGSRCPK